MRSWIQATASLQMGVHNIQRSRSVRFFDSVSTMQHVFDRLRTIAPRDAVAETRTVMSGVCDWLNRCFDQVAQ